MSGVVTPGGLVTSQTYTGSSGDVLVYMVPLFARRWTPFIRLGLYNFEWLNLAASALLWGLLLVPGAWLRVV